MTAMGSIAALQRLTMQELRVRYTELFGETTAAKNRTWLLRRVAWRVQCLAEGDLSERARQRAAELASDADLRTTVPRVKTSPQGDLSGSACQGGAELVKDADLPITVPRLKAPGPVASECSQATPPGCRPDPRLPMPGTILTRDYKGQTLQVEVLAEGFAYAGQSYKSLSAVAKAVTGAHCNGFHFFRSALSDRGGAA